MYDCMYVIKPEYENSASLCPSDLAERRISNIYNI